MFSSLYRLPAGCADPSSPVGLFDRIDEPSGVVQLASRSDGRMQRSISALGAKIHTPNDAQREALRGFGMLAEDRFGGYRDRYVYDCAVLAMPGTTSGHLFLTVKGEPVEADGDWQLAVWWGNDSTVRQHLSAREMWVDDRVLSTDPAVQRGFRWDAERRSMVPV